MNLPNKLTVFRILLVPIFVIFYYMGYNSWATTVFIIASFTDFLDGYIARKNNIVTDFGKFMDPLADKILVISALLLLMEKGKFGAWVLIIIIAREFTVSGLRLVAADNQIAIAASKLGKLKTVLQMVAVILMLSESFNLQVLRDLKLEEILLYLSVFMTAVSGIDYIIKNRQVLKSEK